MQSTRLEVLTAYISAGVCRWSHAQGNHSEGGGGKGPSNMVNQGPSNMVPRATQRAEAPLMWRTSARIRSRATQRAEAPLMRRTSARVRSFPACATSTTKSPPPVAASAQGRAFVRGGISLMWPPPTRQTQPSAASRPIAHPPVQQSSQGLRAAYARGGTSLMRPPLTRHTHSP